MFTQKLEGEPRSSIVSRQPTRIGRRAVLLAPLLAAACGGRQSDCPDYLAGTIPEADQATAAQQEQAIQMSLEHQLRTQDALTLVVQRDILQRYILTHRMPDQDKVALRWAGIQRTKSPDMFILSEGKLGIDRYLGLHLASIYAPDGNFKAFQMIISVPPKPEAIEELEPVRPRSIIDELVPQLLRRPAERVLILPPNFRWRGIDWYHGVSSVSGDGLYTPNEAIRVNTNKYPDIHVELFDPTKC